MTFMRPLLTVCLVMAMAVSLAAQEPEGGGAPKPASGPAGALSIRQERVKRMMQDLERKFTSLSQALEKTEPEQAKRLVEAFQRSRALRVEERMEQIVRLLGDSQLGNATDRQQEIIADLKRLIEMLLKEDSEWDRIQKEIDRLEDWRDRTRKLLDEERGHRRESSKVAKKDQTLADLARRIQAVEALIERQEEILGETEKSPADGIQRLPQLADKEREVRRDTEQLADDIAGKAAQSPRGDDSAGDAGGEGGGQEGEGSPSGGSPSGEPGEQPLRDAAGHQKAAENNLAGGKGKASQGDQQRALGKLNDALKQLKRERSRIASLPPEVLEEMARRQDDTADKTEELGDDMAKANEQSGGDPSGGDPSGGDPSGANQPGQKQVGEAQKSMRKASDSLGKKDPSDAGGHQDDAAKQLEKALEEIEKRLAQLREEMQAERLARLEARFREMLSRQKKVSLSTIELHEKNTPDAELRRVDRIMLAKLAEEELALAESAQQALEIIIEDGTSVVFPRVVAHLRDDLESAARLLDDRRTDDYTQSVQNEIERTLEELIEALEKAQEIMECGGCKGKCPGGQQGEPLLPNSAELKLLRASQLRVNRQTDAFDRARTDPLDGIMRQEVAKITGLQQEVAIMAEEMVLQYSGADFGRP